MQTQTRQSLQVRFCDELLIVVLVSTEHSCEQDSICLTFGCMVCLFFCFFFCSPSQGPCCTTECTFKTNSEVCRPDSECANEGRCGGNTALCPASQPKANFTSCHKDTQVCINGVCSYNRLHVLFSRFVSLYHKLKVLFFAIGLHWFCLCKARTGGMQLC